MMLPQPNVSPLIGNPMSNAQTRVSDDDQRWRMLQQRVSATGEPFVYAVKTTGIYCRPGCSSRMPRRENVLFFDQARQARAAGFRACKRCLPDAAESPCPQAEAVEVACRMIEQADETPSLQQLATATGYSPSHFHKLFKQSLGVTPKAYAATRRADRVRAHLQEHSTVTQAVYASGYGSSSRFYEESDEVLGMKPSDYIAGAPAIEIGVAVARTPLGLMMVAATARGLCSIEFGDDEATLWNQVRKRFPRAQLTPDADFQDWVREIIEHLEHPGIAPDLPLDIQGTAFQRRVWEALRRVPAGTTTTYSDVAKEIGQPKAVRAVAGACAANKIAVLIPCHRVVRSDGGMGGYRWGIDRKRALIKKEAEKR